MTAEAESDAETRLRDAEASLRRAFTAALGGGSIERPRLMAAVERCRLARLAARGSWAYRRRAASAASGPARGTRPMDIRQVVGRVPGAPIGAPARYPRLARPGPTGHRPA